MLVPRGSAQHWAPAPMWDDAFLGLLVLTPFSSFEDELQALRSWFQTMNLLEPCRSAAESVLTPKGAQEFKAYLQKQPGPSLHWEKPATNEPEVLSPTSLWHGGPPARGLAALGGPGD